MSVFKQLYPEDPNLLARCPFCDGAFRAGVGGEDRPEDAPAVHHTQPPCKEIVECEDDCAEFLARVRRSVSASA